MYSRIPIFSKECALRQGSYDGPGESESHRACKLQMTSGNTGAFPFPILPPPLLWEPSSPQPMPSFPHLTLRLSLAHTLSAATLENICL